MDGTERSARERGRRTDVDGRSGPDLPARVAAHLRDREIVRPGRPVVVAVSGGLDSVALLHLLRFRLPAWNLSLRAAHFDHRMREGSTADADWVAGLCRAWRVPLERGAAESPPSSEASARAARYRFLHRIAERSGPDTVRILTAHHADDQAETVLFRAIRGTGIRGLCGIPERRGPFVRPLLPFRRAEIAAYGRAEGLRYREDPTNRGLDYARNRIRHEVLPRLESIAPGAAEALVRLAGHARAAETAWDQVLDRIADEVVRSEEDGLVLARPRLLSYDSYIQARLLRRLLRRYGSRPDRAGTHAVLSFIRSGRSGGRIDVRGDVTIEREFDRIRIRRRTPRTGAPGPDRILIAGPEGGSSAVVIGGRRYRVRWGEEAGDGIDGAAFDASELRFPLEVRPWRAGDRVTLSYGTKKLKKLFGERRVGRSDRTRIPILADADGRVLWIVGLERAHGIEPVPGHPVLRISVSDGKHD